MKIQKPTFLLVMLKPTKYIKENKESRSFFNFKFMQSSKHKAKFILKYIAYKFQDTTLGLLLCVSRNLIIM
jgi:hypothetical protein